MAPWDTCKARSDGNAGQNRCRPGTASGSVQQGGRGDTATQMHGNAARYDGSRAVTPLGS